MVIGVDDALILAGIAAAGTAASGYMNYAGAQQVNSANAANTVLGINFAREQRNWQEAMSNSAYQRATADMKLAGINPLLAYSQGGASSPTPTGQAQFGPVQNKLGQASQAAMQTATTVGNLYAQAAGVDLSRANTDLSRQSAVESVARSANYSAQTVQALQSAGLIKQDTARSTAQTALAVSQRAQSDAVTALTGQSTQTEAENTRLRQQQTRTESERTTAAINENERWRTYGPRTHWGDYAASVEQFGRSRLRNPNFPSSARDISRAPWANPMGDNQ